MASSSIVIKVKFGETLRRLNASINDKKLVYDMVMLKEKIRSLFGFGSDVEFTMTYVDEDGDAVTLADDADLHDVVRQSLNPLRITVTLKSSNFNGPSGNFTSLNSGETNIEASLDALAKLSLDLACKAPSSAPAVAKFVQKMKAVCSNQILPTVASLMAHPTTGGPPKVNSESSVVKDSKVQVNTEAGGSNKKEKQVQKVTEGVKVTSYFDAPISSTGKNENIAYGVEKKDPSSEKKDGDNSQPLKHDGLASFTSVEQLNQMRQASHDQMVAQIAKVAADRKKSTNDSGRSSIWAQGMWKATNNCPFSGMPLTNDSDSQEHNRRSCSPHWKRHSLDNNGTGSVFHQGVICDGCEAHPIIGPRFKSKVKVDYDLCSACFAKTGNATDYMRLDHPINSFRHHLMSFKGFHDPSLRVPPPTLPHAMQASGSKLDSRFTLDVNVLDGTIMAPFTAFTKIWRMRNNGSIIWPYGSQLQWIGGDQLSKTHSVDVKIPVDGLPVDNELDIAVDFTAPGLPGRYVSYWRMAAPSGQMFGQRIWVLIQVDASMKNWGDSLINLNLPPVTGDLEAVNNIITDSENTSVDLPPKDSLANDNCGAPSTMATLSAPPATASSPVFNSTEVGMALGSLPVGPTVTEPIVYDTDDFFLSTPIMNSGSSSLPTVALGSLPAGPTVTEPIDFDTDDFFVTTPVMNSGSSSPPTVALGSLPVGPTVDLSLTTPIVNSGSLSLPTMVVQPSGSGKAVSDDKELALVKDLEEMGFKQLDLNKEVLRMNNYDLEKSIDDLCGVLEWDPMLDELHEMGFADDEANRRLLKKNNGSIKGVVMDLINEEQ